MKKKVLIAQDIFLDKVNQSCNKFGLNSIMAQLYSILYLTGKPMSLDDMVDRLKISKASASINIRNLERYGVVRRVLVRGTRKDFYEAEPDIARVILDRARSMIKGRLSELDDMINTSSEALGAGDGQHSDPDEDMRIFNEKMSKLKSLYVKAKALFSLFEEGMLSQLLSDDNDAAKKEGKA